jgi:hypothetical protein
VMKRQAAGPQKVAARTMVNVVIGRRLQPMKMELRQCAGLYVYEPMGRDTSRVDLQQTPASQEPSIDVTDIGYLFTTLRQPIAVDELTLQFVQRDAVDSLNLP